MKTPHHPHLGKNGEPLRYRYISIVAPMAPHDTHTNRQRNMKLYYVLRWFLYTQTPGSRFFCTPTPAESMPHGGMCLRARCAASRETFLNSAAFQELLRLLKEERLTSCLYMFDGYADGADKDMPPIELIDQSSPRKLQLSELEEGRNLDRGHIPYFAHQMLVDMKNKPVDSIECSEQSYRDHFGL